MARYRNATEVKKAIDSLDDIVKKKELIMYNKGVSFLNNSGYVHLIDKELGNYRLPSEDIRKSSAKWYYEKEINRYKKQINYIEEDDKQRVMDELYLFKTLYEDEVK